MSEMILNPKPKSFPKHTAQVVETLNFVKKFCGKTMLIKIGGALLQDHRLLIQLCDDLSLMRACGISLVIVHGGGVQINQELEAKGITWSFHEGQRVTTLEMMGVVEMVLRGKINSPIIRTLNTAGVKAVGLSGADGGLLQCSRLDPRLGEVGQIDKVNTEILNGYLEGQKKSMQGYIPVIAPMGVDLSGQALNINADWACSVIAQALGIVKVIYLTDQDGILNHDKTLISEVDLSGLQKLIDTQVVQGGMLAKTKTIIKALESGVEQIHIINGSRAHSLIEEIFTDRGIGTICRAQWN